MYLPFLLLSCLLFGSLSAIAQEKPFARQLPATRTTATFKIDGILEEPEWKEAQPATNFVEWRQQQEG